MIQRIQSIYLLLAGLFPVFTLFVPLVTTRNGVTCSSCALSYIYKVVAVLAIALALISIFKYNNRKVQLKWANAAMLSNVVWYVAFATTTYVCVSQQGGSFAPHIGLLFPLLSIIILFLAKKSIKHDEALVRAADRIR